ncbi:MAG: PG0541 family transporter-associated protein [Spirochaetota bacterium]
MSDVRVMVFIVYDRAIDEEILDVLNELEIQDYTKWRDVQGVGSHDPHMGDSVWPGLNNVLMVVIDEYKKDILLEKIKSLQSSFTGVGLRAFVVPLIGGV